jgi:hypothetical protein
MASEFKWRGTGSGKAGESELPARRAGLPPLREDAGAGVGRQRRRRRADKDASSVDDAASVAESVPASVAGSEPETQVAASRDTTELEERRNPEGSTSGTGRRRRGGEARAEYVLVAITIR